MNSIYFREEQRFPLWVKLIVGAVSLMSLVGALFAAQDKKEMIAVLLVFLIAIGITNAMLWSFKLKTKIANDVFEIQSSPLFGTKKIHMNDLVDLKLIRNFQFGKTPIGLGYRLDWKGNVYHKANGFKGIWLKRKEGKNIFIGSQKIEELEEIVEYWKTKYGSTKA